MRLESDPECEGQSQIHVFSAVVFFIIYNLNMVILTIKDHSFASGAALAAVLLVFKLRFVPAHVAPGLLGDQTLLATFEWLDTLAIQADRLVRVQAPRRRHPRALGADSAATRRLRLPVPADGLRARPEPRLRLRRLHHAAQRQLLRGVPGHPLTEASANRRVEIIFADVQGKEENLRESARYRPACFVSDGSHRREM